MDTPSPNLQPLVSRAGIPTGYAGKELASGWHNLSFHGNPRIRRDTTLWSEVKCVNSMEGVYIHLNSSLSREKKRAHAKKIFPTFFISCDSEVFQITDYLPCKCIRQPNFVIDTDTFWVVLSQYWGMERVFRNTGIVPHAFEGIQEIWMKFQGYRGTMNVLSFRDILRYGILGIPFQGLSISNTI